MCVLTVKTCKRTDLDKEYYDNGGKLNGIDLRIKCGGGNCDASLNVIDIGDSYDVLECAEGYYDAYDPKKQKGPFAVTCESVSTPHLRIFVLIEIHL